ncbi:MAG: ATP-dependent zinc metalloprotease FtsH [Spirochaetales bacterium]|nr:ATP-dependent zinc metalloprotease FtsH [Spirochaetales bacterium]
MPKDDKDDIKFPKNEKGPEDWRNRFQPPNKNNKNGGGKKFRFSIWYFFLVVAVLGIINMFMMGTGDSKTIDYSRFKELIASGRIQTVKLTSSYYTGYTYKKSEVDTSDPLALLGELQADRTGANSTVFRTVPINDPNFLPLLEEYGVEYYAVHENSGFWLELLVYWVFPIAFFIIIWRVLMRRMGGGANFMGIGQNQQNRIVAEKDLKTRFRDVAGCDEAKDELVEVVDFLKNAEKYTKIGGKIPRGALLVGPPGTGKTLLARAVAGEAGVTFFRMSGADFVEMFVGVGAARVRDLFKQAREKAPCIIFIDELDAIGKSRANNISSNDEREQTLNQLLVEMDGFDSSTGVIILAATNRPEVLDPALLRPGRFDRQVVVDKPDQIGREAILKIHAEGVKLDETVDFADVAKVTAGLAGADLANIVNEAALLAVRRGADKVSKDDFMEAMEKTSIGLEKKNKLLNPHERETTAYHETGHALVNVFTPDQHLVKKITIVPRGYGIMGYMLPVPEEERSFQTREELLGRIDVALGGRAAEEIIYGTVSTGAGNDIERATDIARAMVTRLGMSERFANVSLDKRGSSFLGQEQGGYSAYREYSEETQRFIDEEIARIMSESYVRVKALLEKHKELLEKITSRLMDDETIEREELMAMIDEDELGKEEFASRKSRDLKPSDRAKESGEARNQAIKERMEARRKEQEERERLEKEKKEREEKEQAELRRRMAAGESTEGDAPKLDDNSSE